MENTPELWVKAEIYRGRYGGTDNVGEFVDVSISPGELPVSNKNKDVYLLLDVSGSMHKSIDLLKASLRALRDTLIGRDENTPSSDLESMITESVDLNVITFSSEVRPIWPHQGHTFEGAVDHIRAEGCTNIGDALALAINMAKAREGKASWIILMSDGIPNKGICQTEESLKELASSKPPNTKIYTIGYGENHKEDILRAVGTYVNVPNVEEMAGVFGSISAEIMTSVWADVRVEVKGMLSIDNGKKVVAGNGGIDAIYSTSDYHYIYLPLGDHTYGGVDALLEGSHVIVSYTDIASGERRVIKVDTTRGGPISEKTRLAYFRAAKKRYIKYLLRQGQSGIPIVEEKISKWEDPLASSIKKEIELCITNVLRGETKEAASVDFDDYYCNIASINTSSKSKGYYSDYI